jgi:hypothetical protein
MMNIFSKILLLLTSSLYSCGLNHLGDTQTANPSAVQDLDKRDLWFTPLINEFVTADKERQLEIQDVISRKFGLPFAIEKMEIVSVPSEGMDVVKLDFQNSPLGIGFEGEKKNGLYDFVEDSWGEYSQAYVYIHSKNSKDYVVANVMNPIKNFRFALKAIAHVQAELVEAPIDAVYFEELNSVKGFGNWIFKPSQKELEGQIHFPISIPTSNNPLPRPYKTVLILDEEANLVSKYLMLGPGNFNTNYEIDDGRGHWVESEGGYVSVKDYKKNIVVEAALAERL